MASGLPSGAGRGGLQRMVDHGDIHPEDSRDTRVAEALDKLVSVGLLERYRLSGGRLTDLKWTDRGRVVCGMVRVFALDLGEVDAQLLHDIVAICTAYGAEPDLSE